MNKLISHHLFVAMTCGGLSCVNSAAIAQIAGGSTTVGVSVTESTEIALGWSVKRTLMGKSIQNDAGQRIGKVEDLIVAPDKNVSYVIVGAGGFLGIGRHDVAIPVSQITNKAGKLVMAGGTKELIKSMPVFSYAADTTGRDRFMAAAENDIAKGKSKIADLDRRAGVAAADAKAKITADMTALQADIKLAEDKLEAMRQASASIWKQFAADVNVATERLRKSMATITS